jgi:hypothetical protein
MNREKPAFDKLNMLSRFARLSNLYLISPLERKELSVTTYIKRRRKGAVDESLE